MNPLLFLFLMFCPILGSLYLLSKSEDEDTARTIKQVIVGVSIFLWIVFVGITNDLVNERRESKRFGQCMRTERKRTIDTFELAKKCHSYAKITSKFNYLEREK